MEKFRLAPLEPLDFITPDASASPPAPMSVSLELDTRNGSLCISYQHQCDNAVPMSVWHGLVLRWDVPVALDAQQFTEQINTGDLDALFSRIVEGTEIVWDGNNCVARYDDDADAAIEEVRDWVCESAPLPDNGGLWDASDWLASLNPQDIDGLTAKSTDAELEVIAERLEEQAKSEYAVLYNTVGRLRQFREELQDAKEVG